MDDKFEAERSLLLVVALASAQEHLHQHACKHHDGSAPNGESYLINACAKAVTEICQYLSRLA